MTEKMGNIITMEEVIKRNLCKMLTEHSMLGLGGNVDDFFKRFGTQIKLFHSKLDTDFDYLPGKVQDMISKIYRQYECVVKGVGKKCPR